jgi:hypothetical protein
MAGFRVNTTNHLDYHRLDAPALLGPIKPPILPTVAFLCRSSGPSKSMYWLATERSSLALDKWGKPAPMHPRWVDEAGTHCDEKRIQNQCIVDLPDSATLSLTIANDDRSRLRHLSRVFEISFSNIHHKRIWFRKTSNSLLRFVVAISPAPSPITATWASGLCERKTLRRGLPGA